MILRNGYCITRFALQSTHFHFIHTTSQDALYKAIQKGNIRQARLAYESLSENLDRPLIQKLLKLVSHSKRKDDLYFMDRVLKEMNNSSRISPTHFEYHTLMYAYGVQKLPEKAYSILQRMSQEAKLEPTIYSYNTLLGCYKRTHNVQRAEELLAEMKARNIKADTVTYNTMLHLLLKTEEFNKLFNMFQRMMDEKVSMDVYTYSTMLDAVIKSKDPLQRKVGERICEHLIQKQMVDVNTVNNMIRFMAETDLNKAFNFYLSLDKRYPHIKPDRVTFNILLGLFLKNGNPARAYMMFQDMKKMNLNPDLITYSILIDAKAKEGNLKEAILIFKDMCNASIEPNERILNSLVNIASSKSASSSDLNELISLIEQYQERLQLDTQAYNSLMYGLALNGRSEQVQYIYDSRFRNMTYYPDIITFTNLILAYINDDLIEDAIGIYQTFRDYYKKTRDDSKRNGRKIDIELDTTFYLTLISALTNNEPREQERRFVTTYDPEDSSPRLRIAMTMMNDMRQLGIKPTTYNYTALLHACGRYRDQYVLEQIHNLIKVDLYLDPDIGLYNSLIDAYNRTGNGYMVLDIWQTLLVTPTLSPDSITVSIVLDSCGHNGLWDYAPSIWKWLKRTDFKLNTNNYNSYIECLCRARGRTGWDMARQIVENEMQSPLQPKHGLAVIDEKTINTLISFAKKKDFDVKEIEDLEKWKASLFCIPPC
ncbi:uncharacterized protein BX663DRAFT_511816 [Cokeromyces recurvatus]|uniref:uncharacterized protein n=1 Tax=Cokeromyces recurvatus TaxID=90255 RepID=UPI0022208730|nr:uncharacterized protein BX663DRAFT_511816 [Cokeromyces recurvatus]KAI7902123.1 hypothetical protein BX663DRAFT_511816 [Cokeromyces recurvatus]